jgi:hypothetical protein
MLLRTMVDFPIIDSFSPSAEDQPTSRPAELGCGHVTWPDTKAPQAEALPASAPNDFLSYHGLHVLHGVSTESAWVPVVSSACADR